MSERCAEKDALVEVFIPSGRHGGEVRHLPTCGQVRGNNFLQAATMDNPPARCCHRITASADPKPTCKCGWLRDPSEPHADYCPLAADQRPALVDKTTPNPDPTVPNRAESD